MARDITTVAREAAASRQEAADRPTVQQWLAQPWVLDEVQKQLGPGYDAGVYVRSVVSSIKAAPDLNNCDPATIFGGLFTAAQLHLEIGSGLGQAYLIPRKNSKLERDGDQYGGWQASFQIGYPGLIALAYRSGVIEGADAELVMVGDRFKRGANSERGKFFDHEYGPEHDNPGTPIMGVLGMFWTRNASKPVWRYLTLEQVEERRPNYTRDSWHKGPWVTNYPQMVEKTGLINGLRFAPKSAHLALAMSMDDAVLSARREAPDEVTAKHEDRKAETVSLASAANGGTVPPEEQ